MSPAQWIEYYAGAGIERAGVVAGPALRGAAGERLAALAVLPGRRDPVICHSDLHTFNLIDSGHALVLLDWEYAHAADPLWDLAGWSANNDLEDGLTQELLAAYLGRAPTRPESMRLRLLSWLYDYICLMWSELYLDPRREGRPGGELRGEISGRAALLAARLDASK
jgi:aminoglycoside phosphotransferase (APT) family kinase protein